MQKNFNYVDHGLVFPNLTDDTSDKGRFYTTPEGNIYPSVTTVLKERVSPYITQWRDSIGHEAADGILKQAGIRGTVVHQIVEDYMTNDKQFDSKSYNSFNYATFNDIKPIIDNHIDNIWAQEVTVYSDKLKTAGRVDLLAEYDGVLSVIDFKTSRNKKDEEKAYNYFIQESVYCACLYEMFKLKVNQIVTIIAVDNDDPITFQKRFQPSYINEFIKLTYSLSSKAFLS